MKKIFALIISVLAFLSVSNLQVKAANYEGTLGYNYTSTQTKFFYLVENEAVSNVNLYLADNPAASMILDDSTEIFIKMSCRYQNEKFWPFFLSIFLFFFFYTIWT